MPEHGAHCAGVRRQAHGAWTAQKKELPGRLRTVSVPYLYWHFAVMAQGMLRSTRTGRLDRYGVHTDLNLDVRIMSEKGPRLSALEIPNLS